MKDQTHNLNPHKSAVAAMYLYGKRYSAQGGGSMDFWNKLSDSDKRLARELVDRILEARPETL